MGAVVRVSPKNVLMSAYAALQDYTHTREKGRLDDKEELLNYIKQALYQELAKMSPEQQLPVLKFISRTEGEVGEMLAKLADKRHTFITGELNRMAELDKTISKAEKDLKTADKMMMSGTALLAAAMILTKIPFLAAGLAAGGAALMAGGIAMKVAAEKKMAEAQTEKALIQGRMADALETESANEVQTAAITLDGSKAFREASQMLKEQLGALVKQRMAG